MRSSFVVASLFVAGTAAADPEIIVGPSDTAPVDRAAFVYRSPTQGSGMWLDFGAGVERVAVGNGNVYNGKFVRFAPLTTIRRHFYIGAEIDVGSFDGNPVPTDASSRTMTGGSTVMADAQAGTLCAAKVVAGARAMAGIFSGGVELAGGVQYTELATTVGTNDVGHGVIEARGRLDLWVSPHVSIGGMVGTDLTEKNNMTAGLQLGFHFEPYDHSR